MKKVYICTPLNPAKFNLVKIMETLLKYKVFGFIPPAGQLQNKTLGAQLDKLMIEACNEVFVFGPIGRDCAWEMGYAAGLGKPITVFLDDSNNYIKDEDWMVPLNANFIEEDKQWN